MSDESGLLVQFLTALGVVLILILALAWIVKKLNKFSLRVGAEGEGPRLSITEAISLDHKRRLVLLKRDQVEHLVLIGGENDLLIEPSIHHHAHSLPNQSTQGQGHSPAPNPAQMTPQNQAMQPPVRPPLPPHPDQNAPGQKAPTPQQAAPQPAKPTRPPLPSQGRVPVETERQGYPTSHPTGHSAAPSDAAGATTTSTLKPSTGMEAQQAPNPAKRRQAATDAPKGPAIASALPQAPAHPQATTELQAQPVQATEQEPKKQGKSGSIFPTSWRPTRPQHKTEEPKAEKPANKAQGRPVPEGQPGPAAPTSTARTAPEGPGIDETHKANAPSERPNKSEESTPSGEHQVVPDHIRETKAQPDHLQQNRSQPNQAQLDAIAQPPMNAEQGQAESGESGQLEEEQTQPPAAPAMKHMAPKSSYDDEITRLLNQLSSDGKK